MEETGESLSCFDIVLQSLSGGSSAFVTQIQWFMVAPILFIFHVPFEVNEYTSVFSIAKSQRGDQNPSFLSENTFPLVTFTIRKGTLHKH